MNNGEEIRVAFRNELGLAIVFWFIVGAAVTYLVNRRRQTAGWAKVSLFMALWGIVTVIPLLVAVPAGHLALSQIRPSGGALKGKAQVWFGLLCGYAWLTVLIGCVAFGVGFFSREYRYHRAREANLNLIENAKTAWTRTNNKNAGDVPTADELAPFMPGGQFPPSSIDGEKYEINPLGTKANAVPAPPEY